MSSQNEGLVKDREEYNEILSYLQKSEFNEVLAPLDGEGREFWVQAVTNPNDDEVIKLDIGNGEFKKFDKRGAIIFLQDKIKELNEQIVQ